MQKVTCDVIKDLMPLYVDDVLSNDSKKLVEEHIAECDKCRELYKKIKEDITCLSDKTNHDKEVIQKIRSSIRRNKTKAVCIAVFSVTVIAAIVLLGTIDAMKQELVIGNFTEDTVVSAEVLEFHKKEIELKELIMSQDEDNITDVSVNLSGTAKKIMSADIYIESKKAIGDMDTQKTMISIVAECLGIEEDNVSIYYAVD